MRKAEFVADEQRKKLMHKYLDEMYQLYKDWQAGHTRYLDSLTEYVQDYLRIPINSYSPWTKEIRLPSHDFADLLMRGLTRDVYYICAYPARSPDDNKFNIVEDQWQFTSEKTRDEVVNLILEDERKREEAKKAKEEKNKLNIRS